VQVLAALHSWTQPACLNLLTTSAKDEASQPSLRHLCQSPVVAQCSQLNVIRVIRVISPPTRPLAIFFRMEKSGQNARESWASNGEAVQNGHLWVAQGPPGRIILLFLGSVMIFGEYKEFSKILSYF